MSIDSDKRSFSFKRNPNLEILMGQLNDALAPVEQNFISASECNYPLIFIVGPLRSGSTLMMQWLARTKQIAYPTNLLSRFFKAPVVGAKIQQLLTDPKYQFRNEFDDLIENVGVNSFNGKTSGTLSPNEFWYFWRRFLPFDKLDYCSSSQLLQKVDTQLLVSELSSLANTFQKPFALKGMILNYNIDFLASLFNKVIFIQTKREPAANIASVLDARVRQYGNVEEWYSFKGPDYLTLKDEIPEIQAAGQVYYINKAVDDALKLLPEEQKLIVQYEDFCANPKHFYQQLREKLAFYGVELTENYTGEKSFKPSRNPHNYEELIHYYNRFSGTKSGN